MNDYYYGASDTVYSTWDDSTLKAWLVEHDIIKSDAQVKRDKMYKMVADNYATARDTVWGGWTDSELREWLIEHGYMRSEAQVKRDELIKTMNEKYPSLSLFPQKYTNKARRYHEAATKGASYTTWPDARLRAYLRSNGIPEDHLPTGRPSLLHRVRIRWIQSNNTVESMLQAIRDALTNSVGGAEAKLQRVLEMLTSAKESAYHHAGQGYGSAKSAASSLSSDASASISSASSVAGKSASSASSQAARSASSKYSKASSKASSSSSSSVAKASKSAKNEL
jgi:hypothetical protein